MSVSRAEPGSGAPQREALRRVLREWPRMGLVLAAIFSSLPTLALAIAVNLAPRGLPGMFEAFAALYLATLPVTAAGVALAYRLAALLDTRCLGREGGGLDALSILASLAPLGFIVALYQLGRRLQECKATASRRLAGSGIDIALNIITFGLHAPLYALLLERLVALNLEEQGEAAAQG